MAQKPQKNNTLLIVAVIGVVGTVLATTIGVIGNYIGNYNIEKLRQDSELTKIALVSIATQGGATQIVLQTTADAPTQLPYPTYTPYPTPEMSLGHRQVQELGSSDLILTANQVAIGTADRFQDVVNVSNPPFTIFVIYGEVNTQLNMYWGGWDLWENASESFVESQILLKIDEVKGSHASDYAKRGYRVIKCYGQVENCENTLTFP